MIAIRLYPWLISKAEQAWIEDLQKQASILDVPVLPQEVRLSYRYMLSWALIDAWKRNFILVLAGTLSFVLLLVKVAWDIGHLLTRYI